MKINENIFYTHICNTRMSPHEVMHSQKREEHVKPPKKAPQKAGDGYGSSSRISGGSLDCWGKTRGRVGGPHLGSRPSAWEARRSAASASAAAAAASGEICGMRPLRIASVQAAAPRSRCSMHLMRFGYIFNGSAHASDSHH